MNWWGISEVWEVQCHHVNFEGVKLFTMGRSFHRGESGVFGNNRKTGGASQIMYANVSTRGDKEKIKPPPKKMKKVAEWWKLSVSEELIYHTVFEEMENHQHLLFSCSLGGCISKDEWCFNHLTWSDSNRLCSRWCWELLRKLSHIFLLLSLEYDQQQ